MATELAKAYDPKEAQAKWLAYWDAKNFGHSEPDGRTPYSIVIPPPNVTGALHMGHALNNTLQDVLIRWRRMQGYNAEWMPGTDHAGIATQSVVERRILAEEKKTRRDIGREELVKRIWAWKDQYEKRILGQLKQIGCSCDWPRTAFTLDEPRSRAVRETFFRMFRDGYIFRGKRLVNWDPQLQTSVADDETYTEDVKGGFWTFKYPVNGLADTFIRFSTTRPETMLGDTAVCVHPSDERYKHLIGKTVTVPLVGREIPIIADGLLADPELGTGCVKVTPAHDPNDYACYLRHPEIGIINILNPDGTINENGGKYQGFDRAKAREAVVAEMESLGFFEGKEDRIIPLKFSDRSKTPIEPYLSDQWFVKMGDREDGKPGLAQMAMDAVTSGRVKIFPSRYANTYLEWLGEKRDWCISRQLWWGHQIPIWYKVEEQSRQTMTSVSSPTPKVLIGMPREKWQKALTIAWDPEHESETSVRFMVCVAPGNEAIENALEADGFERDPDVLDTWFSSMLWTHSTFGWPEQTPELKYYYPTSTLVTSRDIITLWVARMVIAGLYNLNEVPFRHVYITPKMLDGFGEGMSKSKGNGVDPLDIVENYGADALRFQMVSIAGETQDSRLPVSNICPHCGKENPVKQEHMYMRTKKLACASCKKPFRPGGPWPEADPELPTATQGSERFEIGRNFANKMWNATRFILMNLEGYTPGPLDPKSLPIEDRWILSRLATTANAVTEMLEGYRFNEVSRTIYDFTWSEFCDWYLEMAKGRFRSGEPGASATGGRAVQRVLVGVLDGILRLVQPIMPFVAESLWHALNEVAPERGLPTPAKATESVVVASWPTLPAEWQDPAMETRIARMQELVRIVRDVRNRYSVDSRTPLDVFVRCTDVIAADFQALRTFITSLAGVGTLETGPAVAKPKQSASQVTPEFEVYVSLAGLIDPAAEVKRLEKQIADKRKQLEGTKGKLANEGFVSRAPAEVVAQQKELVVDLEKQIASMEESIGALKA
ncbi:MAG TPA: valine--tRNA ligase [Gemmataceae bacterium]|nr:valine--tRNA ligase [Gemmataceae bacterium]